MSSPTPSSVILAPPPGQISLGAGGVVVPDVSDAAREAAEKLLQDQAFVVKTEDVESLGGTPGTVLRQDPQAGQRRPKGSVVTLYVRRKSPAATDPLEKVTAAVDAVRTEVTKGVDTVNTTVTKGI